MNHECMKPKAIITQIQKADISEDPQDGWDQEYLYISLLTGHNKALIGVLNLFYNLAITLTLW